MAESSESEVPANGGISSQEDSVDDVWIENNPEEENEFSSTVNVEMETMNTAATTINRLSTELEMARARYARHLSQSMEYIKKLGKDNAKSLERSKPFYDVFKEARELQAKCRNAAVLYEKASQKHQAAKEVVAIAEVELFQRGGPKGTTALNPAWQETLSHGVEKVNVTENAKRESEAEHMRLTAALQHVMERYRVTEIKLRKDIRKAHHYFTERNKRNLELRAMRDAVQKLRSQLAAERKKYGNAIRKLERISDEIHRRRSFSSHAGGSRGRYKDEVSTLEVQAGLVGLNITEDARASDEHIHYRPDDVDDRTSESSSVQLDSESQGSVDLATFECNGVEERLTVERPEQSPLVNCTCAPENVPQQVNGQLLELPLEVTSTEDTMTDTPGYTVKEAPGDTVTSTTADTVTSTPGDTVTDAPGDTVTSTPGDTVTSTTADTVTSTTADTVTNAPADTVTDTPADTVTEVTEVSKSGTVTKVSKNNTMTEPSQDDTVTEVSNEDSVEQGEHC